MASGTGVVLKELFSKVPRLGLQRGFMGPEWSSERLHPLQGFRGQSSCLFSFGGCWCAPACGRIHSLCGRGPVALSPVSQVSLSFPLTEMLAVACRDMEDNPPSQNA